MSAPERRIAASDLDTWRYFKHNDYNTFEQLRNSLLRLTPPGKPAQLGTRFHALLDILAEGGDVDWDSEPIHLAPGLEVELPTAGYTHEVPVKRTIDVYGDTYLISGRLDGYDGDVNGIEFKTTAMSADKALEKYLDSYQWRCYFHCLPELRRIVYHLFLVKSWNPRDGSIPTVVEYAHGPDVYRYANLERDLRNEIAGFADFVDRYVPEYWTRYSKRQKKLEPAPDPDPEPWTGTMADLERLPVPAGLARDRFGRICTPREKPIIDGTATPEELRAFYGSKR